MTMYRYPIARRLRATFLMLSLSLAAIPVLFLARPAAAQSGTFNVSATIQQAIVLGPTTDMLFGTIIAGNGRSITLGGGLAATFSVTGAPSSIFHVTFTFPATLTGGTGGAIPIAPATWTGEWASDVAQTVPTVFSPVSGTAVPGLNLGTVGTLFFRVGAAIAGTDTAGRLGTFAGVVTIVVAYG